MKKNLIAIQLYNYYKKKCKGELKKLRKVFKKENISMEIYDSLPPMVIREFVRMFKKNPEFENRFQKFYWLNQERINSDRRDLYKTKVISKKCVRCKKRSVKGIKLCKYHREKQKEYNKISRMPKKKK